MKYLITFTLSLLMTFGSMLSAQTKYTTSVFTELSFATNTSPCPIANWGKNKTVTFSHSGGQPSLHLIDYSQYFNSWPGIPPAPVYFFHNTINLSLPIGFQDLIINDIYVVDDYAFFCGEFITSGIPSPTYTATWGWFDINEFTSTSLNINYYIFSWGTTAPPCFLFGLVAYALGTEYTVVAYGMGKDNQYKIIEISNALSTTSLPTVNIADMPISPTPPYMGILRIDDILLTEDYVVFTAHDNNIINPTGVEYPWYCYGHKTHVVDDICNLVNPHNYYLPVAWESNGAVIGVALEGNLFAMAYVHSDNSKNFSTRFRVINPNLAQNTHSQEFHLEGKDDPRRMVFLKDSNKVELLQHVNNLSDFLFIDPFCTIPYTTIDYFSTTDDYICMRSIDGHHFISSSKDMFYLQDCSASLPHSDPECPPVDSFSIKPIDTIKPIPAPHGLSGTNTLSADTKNENPSINSISPDCFSFE